jgi:5'/3'-nucleotidase SurE
VGDSQAAVDALGTIASKAVIGHLDASTRSDRINLVALYEALKTAGHDVIVSVPCTGQSGRGGAIVMYSTDVIVPDNDKSQIEAEGGCHNGAAPTGAPAVGRFTKAGFTNGDFYYVHGTPVMATMYGLDVLASARWGKDPDLVLSGPNEGQNVGLIINGSGTVGNVQFAAGRGLPSIALSAGTDTVDNVNLADPDSAVVSQLTVKLLSATYAAAVLTRQPECDPQDTSHTL